MAVMIKGGLSWKLCHARLPRATLFDESYGEAEADFCLLGRVGEGLIGHDSMRSGKV